MMLRERYSGRFKVLVSKDMQCRIFTVDIFTDLQPMPSVEELEKSISIILINSHRSISPPRPGMPGLIDIAGAGIRSPKPLPADIQVSYKNKDE